MRVVKSFSLFAGVVALSVCGAIWPPIAVSGNDMNNSNKEFTATEKMNPADWADPEELDRTWRAALIRLPEKHQEIPSDLTDPSSVKVSPELKRLPTIIYLHGCGGIWSGTHARMDAFQRSGFAVIAPVSFARNKYPQSCDPVIKVGGFYRGVLKMRQLDALHAIQEARKLKWVDPENIFLVGFSEGAIVSATLSAEPDQPLRARVVEGWTCHAGWSEYRGLNPTINEPVLTLVAEGDPWFQNYWTKGDCTEFINKENGSRSVVYAQGPLRYEHSLLDSGIVQQLVISFLQAHLAE
ncbi:MAG: dienelactone hydrolase family protein [Pseudomonadota bacterium]|nr:dienelactone hydrolase family protein [Pseudomonadota bacterium]